MNMQQLSTECEIVSDVSEKDKDVLFELLASSVPNHELSDTPDFKTSYVLIDQDFLGACFCSDDKPMSDWVVMHYEAHPIHKESYPDGYKLWIDDQVTLFDEFFVSPPVVVKGRRKTKPMILLRTEESEAFFSMVDESILMMGV